MQTGFIRLMFTVLALFTFFHTAAQDAGDFVTISGRVYDSQTRKPVENAMVFVQDENLGVVTNEDGLFVLRIPASVGTGKGVRIAHIGYVTAQHPVAESGTENALILLTPVVYPIREISVHLTDPKKIFDEAYARLETNYSRDHERLTTFYRETVKKGNRYITISEAVSDIYKTPYPEGISKDLIQLRKGRRLASPKPSDTIAVKLMGGVNLGVDIDFAKHHALLFSDIRDGLYRLTLDTPEMINDSPHYVINVAPAAVMPYVLLRGRLYIDQSTLAFSRAELSVDMDDKPKAEAQFVRRKPPGMRFSPEEMTYTVAYKKDGGVNRLYYINSDFKFRCDWKRKLFRSRYQIVAEIVVTQAGPSEPGALRQRDALEPSAILSDKVDDFYDPDFWEDYNIIEPTVSLDKAIDMLMKKQ